MVSRTAYSTWTPQKSTLFDGHYLRNRSTLDIGVLGYIGIAQHKEHCPEVLSIPPGTPCIYIFYIIILAFQHNGDVSVENYLIYVRETTKMHTFSHLFIPVKLSSTFKLHGFTVHQ